MNKIFNLILTRKQHANLLALFVTLLMLSLSFAYLYAKKSELSKSKQQRFDIAVQRNYVAISNRLSEMAVILRAVKGYYEGSNYVSQQEYYDFFNALALGDNFSGFQAIAIANLVSNKSLTNHIEDMHARGRLNYQIYPSGARNEYAPITYIEPSIGKNLKAIGFDLLTNPHVKPALLRAKRSGNLAMTGFLSLIQDEKDVLVPATVMYAPIYDTRKSLVSEQEREEALIGWVSGPFRISDFMRSLSKELNGDIGISIFEKGNKFTKPHLYENSRDTELRKNGLKLLGVEYLEIGGTTWEIEMYPLPAFNERFIEPGYVPVVIGITLSLMMGGLIWLLGSGRAIALELANEMTKELKDSEATFRSMAETIPLAIYVANRNSQISEYVNPTFVNLFGYSKDELVTAKDWWQLACPDKTYYLNVIEEWERRVQEGVTNQTSTEPMEMIATCKGGLKKYISWRLIILGNKIYAFGYDLTDTKLAEVELQIAATAFESQSGMMVIDVNQKILRVNKAFETITGYSLNEVKGSSLTLLNSGRQDDAFYREIWTDIKRKGHWEGEIWNQRKNGEIYPVSLNLTSVSKDDNESAYYVGTFNDITSAKAAAEKIQSLAFYDSLTRLPNRRYLLDQLSHALVASKRNTQSGALLFIDLDHFKTLNDTLGHDAGDILLKQVAERLLLCVRETDTVARLGGDEFILLLEGLKDHDIDPVIQIEAIGFKILTALSQPYELNGNSYYSSSSIGITLFGNQQSDANVEDLLRQADIAMYQAKASGRNTLRFFDPEMQDIISARASMETELRTAIQDNQFQLYYQIQVDDAGKTIGCEALIRWVHPTKGMISPIQFIPLAEDTGLIIPIGQWVLETACAQLAAWQQSKQMQHLSISLNVSAKQFHQPNFVKQLKDAIQRYGSSSTLLKLELTESLLLTNIDKTVAIMNELKDIGIQIELDDFGTGYSSLQYLKRLPLSQLKIDQSFVRDIAIDSSDRAIVLTIITMAHTLGLKVIAEGVETEDQRQYLLQNGCIHFQGYLFSKPLPIEQVEALILSNE